MLRIQNTTFVALNRVQMWRGETTWVEFPHFSACSESTIPAQNTGRGLLPQRYLRLLEKEKYFCMKNGSLFCFREYLLFCVRRKWSWNILLFNISMTIVIMMLYLKPFSVMPHNSTVFGICKNTAQPAVRQCVSPHWLSGSIWILWQ